MTINHATDLVIQLHVFTSKVSEIAQLIKLMQEERKAQEKRTQEEREVQEKRMPNFIMGLAATPATTTSAVPSVSIPSFTPFDSASELWEEHCA